MAKKAKGEKKIKVELIPEWIGPRKDNVRVEPYEILDRLREAHHAHLSEARIALVWAKGVKEDKDGKLTLGEARKASDLSREFSDHDLVILLNQDAWLDLTPAQREALVDHELMHFAVAKKEGSPVRDERGRLCYRLRQHDVEEFRDIVARHGLYKGDLESFAAACAQARQTPLFAEQVAGKVGT
jgi:hypothetical protein